MNLHRDEPDFPSTELIAPALRREAERVRRALGQDGSADFVLRHADREWRKPLLKSK